MMEQKSRAGHGISRRVPSSVASAPLALALALCLLGTHAAWSQDTQLPRLSVLYFTNTAKVPDFDWLSKGLADMLSGDLGASGSLTLVEREELEKVLREQELALSGLVDPQSAPKLGKLLGADLLLYGSYLVLGGELRIDAKAMRTVSGAAAAVATVTGPLDSVLALERDLAARLAAGLGVSLAAAPPDPANLDAVRAYYRGVDLLDSGDYTAALEFFTRATRLDPLYLKPGRGIEDAYKFLKDFRKQRYRREMNALVEDIAALSARIAAPVFFSFGDAIMAPGKFGFKDAAAATEAYRAHPYRMAGETPVQAIWNLQILFSELGSLALTSFDDKALAARCRDEVLRWSDIAEKAYPRDPFLPEVLYQKIFVYVERVRWEDLRLLCERLMTEYPDFRMMWAVEDFYERALEQLKRN